MAERTFSKNPTEIFTNFSGKDENRVTLAVECYMTPASASDEISPQNLFGKFTRLVFSMIRSGECVKANVNFDDIPDIMERTAFARTRVYENEMCQAAPASAGAEETLPIAYTTTFTMGPFKGRTPADVVMENPDGNRGKLQEQYKFLKENIAKYPRNQVIMDAITNAYDLHGKGLLVKKETTSVHAKGFEIYKSGYRPLMNKKREDGMCPVKEMTITCNIGNRYPMELTITEYYAPVTSVNGKLNVQASQIDPKTRKSVTAYMSMKDWNNLMEKINDQKAAFIATYAPGLIAEADRLNKSRFQQQAV